METVAPAVLGVFIFKDHLDRFTLLGVLFTLLTCISWGIDNHLTVIIDCVSAQTITFISHQHGNVLRLLLYIVNVSYSYISSWDSMSTGTMASFSMMKKRVMRWVMLIETE